MKFIIIIFFYYVTDYNIHFLKEKTSPFKVAGGSGCFRKDSHLGAAVVLYSLISRAQIYLRCTKEELTVEGRVSPLTALFKYSQLRFKPVIFQSQSHFSNNYCTTA